MPSGHALQKRRLCLLGDLESTVRDDSALTVSRYDTTGSEMTMGAPFMKSSWRSLRQISMWSSPQPAMMCSPDSSMEHCTRGSDLERRFRPSTSLGRSLGFLGWTATRTTGDTEYFIVMIGCDSVASASAMVPALRIYWSTPTSAHVLPAVTDSTASVLRPIMRMVRWTFLMKRSSFLPCT